MNIRYYYNDTAQKGGNTFYSNGAAAARRMSAGAGRGSASHGQHGGPVKKPKRKRMPVAGMIVIDVLIAAAMLLVFSLYYFMLPRNMAQNVVELPQPTGLSPAVSSAPAGQSQADENAVSSKDSLDWGTKFAGQFTDGDVAQTDNTYKSANISVSVNKVQQDGVTYYVADIYVRDIQFFRTAFANGTFGYTDPTDQVAQEAGAVIAINGDYCKENHGPVVRNGSLYRDETHSSDVLVLDYDGSMQTYSPGDFDLETVKAEGAWQVWTFGPMLLKDGQPMTEFNSSVTRANPRTAVGYYEPGHYCFVVVDGRQPGYSDGMTMAGLSQLFYDLGCSAAYNMDGGQSSEMVFMGNVVNQPYNGGRSTSDIICITDDKQ